MEAQYHESTLPKRMKSAKNKGPVNEQCSAAI
jgi:hypothetical protein